MFGRDENKATINAKKHGVTFDEAETVFADPLALDGPDLQHSGLEPRRRLIGQSSTGRVLMVVYTLRGTHAEIIRLISTRQANRAERHAYASAQD